MATKILGIRVSANSTLPARMKALSEAAQVQYSDLLEMWVGMAERGEIPGQSLIDFASTPALENVTICARLDALEAETTRIATLEREIRARLDALEAERGTQATPATETMPTQPNRPKGGDRRKKAEEPAARENR